jgi:hypothetical protein
MNLNQKKIIAKEFLYLVLILTITVLTFLFCLTYNLYKNSEIDKLTEAKKSLIQNHKESKNRLKTQLNARIRLITEYCNEFSPEYSDYEIIEALDDWWKIMQKYRNIDTATYDWNNKWSKERVLFNQQYGFKNPAEFSRFINDNSLKKSDSIVLENFDKNLNKIKIQENFITNQKYSKELILKITIYAFIISFLIFFVVRYILIGFIWSKKTLQK